MNEKRRRKKRSNERSQRFISNVRCLSFLLFFFFFYRTRNNSWRSGSVQFGRQLSRQMTFIEFIRALISPREWPWLFLIGTKRTNGWKRRVIFDCFLCTFLSLVWKTSNISFNWSWKWNLPGPDVYKAISNRDYAWKKLYGNSNFYLSLQ